MLSVLALASVPAGRAERFVRLSLHPSLDCVSLLPGPNKGGEKSFVMLFVS